MCPFKWISFIHKTHGCPPTLLRKAISHGPPPKSRFEFQLPPYLISRSRPNLLGVFVNPPRWLPLSCPRIQDVRLLQDEAFRCQTLLILGQLLPPEHIFDIRRRSRTTPRLLRTLYLHQVHLKMLQKWRFLMIVQFEDHVHKVTAYWAVPDPTTWDCAKTKHYNTKSSFFKINFYLLNTFLKFMDTVRWLHERWGHFSCAEYTSKCFKNSTLSNIQILGNS